MSVKKWVLDIKVKKNTDESISPFLVYADCCSISAAVDQPF